MLGVFVLVIVVLLWALVAGRMATHSITTAIAIVVVGMVLTAGSNPVIRINLDTKIVERGVELTLAMLLFLDATEGRGGIIRRERRVLVRLLVIALPISLLIAWLVCLAGATAKHTPAVEALENAVPAILIAIGVGGAIGLGGGVGLGWSWRRNWTEPAALRLGVLALPVMAYTLAIPLGGNGFVAAFAAGLLFAARDRGLPREALQATEDVGTLLSMCVWFVFGREVDQVLRAGVPL